MGDWDWTAAHCWHGFCLITSPPVPWQVFHFDKLSPPCPWSHLSQSYFQPGLGLSSISCSAEWRSSSILTRLLALPGVWLSLGLQILLKLKRAKVVHSLCPKQLRSGEGKGCSMLLDPHGHLTHFSSSLAENHPLFGSLQHPSRLPSAP